MKSQKVKNRKGDAVLNEKKAAPVPDVLQFVPSVGANSQRGCQA